MNTVVSCLASFQPSTGSVFQTPCPGDPAGTSSGSLRPGFAHERTSASYTFVSTERVLAAWVQPGSCRLRPARSPGQGVRCMRH